MQISNSGSFPYSPRGAHAGSADAQVTRARLQKTNDQREFPDSRHIEENPSPVSSQTAMAPVEVTAQHLASAALDEAMIRGRLADNESASAGNRQAIAHYSQVAAQSVEPVSDIEVLGIDVYA
jgi:hypothetical protein